MKTKSNNQGKRIYSSNQSPKSRNWSKNSPISPIRRNPEVKVKITFINNTFLYGFFLLNFIISPET